MIRHSALVATLLVLSACATTDSSGRETLITRESAVVLHNGVNDPFEVKFKAGYGAPDFWCAAGRFAENQNLPVGARIYRLTPSPRPQGSGMAFSFAQPPGGGQPTGLNRISSDPDSLSVSNARDQCRIVQLRTRGRD
jgi:hypothetical protein